MHILHVYEVGTALNNKETVLDQEHHSAPKKPKKVQFGKSYNFGIWICRLKKNFQNILTCATLGIFLIALFTYH